MEIHRLLWHPEEQKKSLSWNLLAILNNQNALPWLCTRDFNEILMESEKKGGAGRRNQLIKNFRDILNICNLHDLGFTGYPFTWSNGREGDDNIQERLDRCLASDSWSYLYPVVKVIHEKKSFSDHCPLTIEFSTDGWGKEVANKKSFKFEEMWTKEPSCERIIEMAWRKNDNVLNNIGSVKNALLGSVFLNIKKLRRRLKELEDQMGKLQKAEPSRENFSAHNTILKELEDLMEKEEIFWRQRSWALWLKEGDKNTKFFHPKANQRQRRNTIKKIRSQEGDWCYEENRIEELAREFFSNFF